MKLEEKLKSYWEVSTLISNWLKSQAAATKKAGRIEIIEKGNEEVLRAKNMWIEVKLFKYLLLIYI
jgi:hypothetical protein